jgi:hypothetical protein
VLPDWVKPFSSAADNYTLYGVLFGSMFPLIATGLRLWEQSLGLEITSILHVQAEDRLLWIIDSAPVWLGLFARIGGVLRDKVQIQIAGLEDQVEERTAEIRSESLLLQQRTEEIKRESAAREEEGQ